MSRNPGDDWYVRSRGKVLGPFGFQQLETLRNQKRLAKFDEVSRGDRRSWTVASSLPELFPSESTSGYQSVVKQAVEESYEVDSVVKAEPATWYYMGPQGSSTPQTMTAMTQHVGSGVVLADTLVWTVEMPDWVAARTVPALGLSRPTTPNGSGSIDSAQGPLATVDARPRVGTGFSVAAFILGLLGLFCGLWAFVLPTVAYSATRNHEIVAIIFFVDLVVWAVLALLSVTFGTVGLVRASRDEKRRGFGFGLTGLILGVLLMAGLSVLVFFTALGVIATVR